MYLRIYSIAYMHDSISQVEFDASYVYLQYVSQPSSIADKTITRAKIKPGQKKVRVISEHYLHFVHTCKIYANVKG